MYLAIDVYYVGTIAKAVGLIFIPGSEEVKATIVEYAANIEDYEPGRFYKRELPCILKLLSKIRLSDIDVIIIDGHVFIDDNGNYGLGGKLWEALNGQVAIIGVAKAKFQNNSTTVDELLRGQSQKPLYVSSVGINLKEATQIIREMKGYNRMPDLLKKVDTLSKE
ncbi:hypothetical protein LJ707_07095 [Mucilaginibacter sp. UR6-1]|uniref:endonuclease V n=1 Tax=Mucilaginibacter sp. UR6-1 TaxID=1435643 RepID=UPI001E5595B2|nr:hypothetical protein [Mucilaginibacter sp. UR6-1]MCC8408689.1 hypothetical protein [Mucilaginibacter sp. UR6-1]